MRRKSEVRHDVEALETIRTGRPAYFPGKEENHVRQAFWPDLAALSGWKA
jgi:hypothetical protein